MHFLKPVIWLVAISAILFILPGCETSQPIGIYVNDKINNGLRDKIHQLDDQLFASAKENNAKHDFEDLLAKEMLDNSEYKRTIDQISNDSKEGKYTLLDEYYINNSKPGLNNDIVAPKDAYKLGYHAPTAQSYLSLMLVQNGVDQWLILAAYSKLDYGWKVSELDFGHYAINGNNAPEMLALAKKQYGKGYLINAVNNMGLATKCLRPVPIWEYSNEKEIADFFGKVSGEAESGFKYPIVIPTNGQPKIFRIMTQTQQGGGYVPTIKYVTKVDVRDTVALKKEFEGIKKAIGKALPGIDQDNKRIIFSAYNTRPTGNTNPFSFDMVYDLK